MAYALVRSVVHIYEKLLPVVTKSLAVDGVSVVLRCDIAFFGSHETHRLVVRTVSVLQLIYCGTGCFAKELVAHAYSTDWFCGLTHVLSDYFHSVGASVRIAWTIGKEESVDVHRRIIVIPWHAYYLHATVYEATYYIGFYTAVDQNDFLSGTLVVSYYLLAGYLVDKVHALVVGFPDIVGFVVEEDFSHHYTVFPEHLGQFTCVDASYSGDVLALEPVGKALHSIPMAVFLAVVGDDYCRRYILSLSMNVGRPFFSMVNGGTP